MCGISHNPIEVPISSELAIPGFFRNELTRNIMCDIDTIPSWIFSKTSCTYWKKLTHNSSIYTLPGLNTTYALISMLHKWNCDTDGNSATVRIVLFDFKKAFDLIDHDILIQKLVSYEIPNNVVNWIIDFLLNRKQRVKLCQDCVSEWGSVPAEHISIIKCRFSSTIRWTCTGASCSKVG